MTNNHFIAHPVPSVLCRSFAALLPVLDEPAVDARAASEARAHVETCAYCQSQLAGYDHLEAALLRHLGPAETPRLQTEDIMRDVLNDTAAQDGNFDSVVAPPAPLPGPHRPARPRRAISGLASLAAALMVMVLVAGLLVYRAGHPQAGSQGSGSPTPLAPSVPGAARGSDTELNALSMVSPNDGWAVGLSIHNTSNAAVLEHLGPPAETQYVNSLKGSLTGVSMISATDGWAVGEQGVLHYNGKQWLPVNSPVQGCSASVQMLSATDGWITGCQVNAQGQNLRSIFHYNGSAWTAQPLPAGLQPNAFSGLSMVSPTEGWVVGNTSQPMTGLMQPSSGSGVTSFILHYKDGQWTVQSVFQKTDLHSVSMASASDGWVAGSVLVNSNPVPFLARYVKGHWTQVANPLKNSHVGTFLTVRVRTANDGWLVSDQDQKTGFPTLLHWDGTRWTVGLDVKQAFHLSIAHSDIVSLLINDIAVLSSSEVRAVGFLTYGDKEALPVNGGYQLTTVPVILYELGSGSWVMGAEMPATSVQH